MRWRNFIQNGWLGRESRWGEGTHHLLRGFLFVPPYHYANPVTGKTWK
ncbi:MAG TPA: hypothetical protein VGV09_07590 [Steroidobacteraceae bacterium]|nr:hypothetical protein [Steroidobacteraceae bacterium]